MQIPLRGRKLNASATVAGSGRCSPPPIRPAPAPGRGRRDPRSRNSAASAVMIPGLIPGLIPGPAAGAANSPPAPAARPGQAASPGRIKIIVSSEDEWSHDPRAGPARSSDHPSHDRESEASSQSRLPARRMIIMSQRDRLRRVRGPRSLVRGPATRTNLSTGQ